MVKIKVHRRLFNESYLPALNNRHRYTVLYGGAGSGKSHFITQRFILDLLQDNITLLVIRKTFASHQATTYQAFRDVIEAMGLSGHVRFYKAPLSIQFKNGSSILFKGAD